MTSHTVAIADYELPGDAADRVLADAGYRVVRAASGAPDDLIQAGRGASALLVQWAAITPEIMAALPELRIISRLGIGYDMIDVPAATARGIAVANTPTYCVEEVAAHTLAMLLGLARGIPGYDGAVRAGRWAPTAAQPMAVRPSSTTVGVVGYGRIGALVAQHCAALGFRVLVVDPFVELDTADESRLRLASWSEAVEQADLLSLHVPLTPETRHLVDAQALAAMRPGAAIVNTCRGALIDEVALAASVRSGHTAAAALDVFEHEPLPAHSPLLELDNVILSPHAAWHSPEALADLPVHCAHNIVRFLAGGDVPAIVNPSYRDALRVGQN